MRARDWCARDFAASSRVRLCDRMSFGVQHLLFPEHSPPGSCDLLLSFPDKASGIEWYFFGARTYLPSVLLVIKSIPRS